MINSAKMKSDNTYASWLASRRSLSPEQLRRDLEQVDIDKLDRWAFGVIGDEIIKLDPKDVTIVHQADLENAKHQASRYSGGPKIWGASVSLGDPVDVSVTRHGEFVLEDGHHRYLAAKLTGRKLKAKVTVKGKPIEHLLKEAKLDREVAAVLRET